MAEMGGYMCVKDFVRKIYMKTVAEKYKEKMGE